MIRFFILLIIFDFQQYKTKNKQTNESNNQLEINSNGFCFRIQKKKELERMIQFLDKNIEIERKYR